MRTVINNIAYPFGGLAQGAGEFALLKESLSEIMTSTTSLGIALDK